MSIKEGWDVNFSDEQRWYSDTTTYSALEVISSPLEGFMNLNRSRSSLFIAASYLKRLPFRMISTLQKNNWLLAKSFVFISIAIPLGLTAYEAIILGNESVVFLADYPSAVGIIVVIYYALLLVAGIIWIIMQLQSFMRLKNENTKNELLHLQSQVNPHFFFNMLNNLYGMVDKDTERSKALILKLSDLMRYSIYEGEKKLVPLEEEIAYLKNYIELHKMRYHKNIDIQFNTNINDDAKIMPLIFIILLENAFKHGVENLRENAFISIKLQEKNGTVDFEIENNFEANELAEEKGIGLKNLKRRLELAYPKKHTLIFTTNKSVFKAQLQLRNG
ncbi:histidine kinase [Flammeovirgaceae bacterium SG7u.111]|nr:histidine kinase [Flammeovirgaceae bacterium SG7u.132]WPO37593.1 histidine kinase [Flammeovirgaceae bacterium SG7u.111]